MIDGVIVTPLKRVHHDKGDILHALKCSDKGFDKFGEAYFSSVIKNQIKGWKKHHRMVMNIIVPFGTVKFVIYDDRDDSSTKGQYLVLTIGEDNYCRITVPPGVWISFQGVSDSVNWLLNIASIEHDPEEASNLPLDAIQYNWGHYE